MKLPSYVSMIIAEGVSIQSYGNRFVIFANSGWKQKYENPVE
jgi:hypothetical protein